MGDANDQLSTFYDQGCALGDAAAGETIEQNAVAILDFGGQTQESSVWGAQTIGAVFNTMAHIKAAVESFGLGYFVCTGTHTTSSLTIDIGTNNDLTTNTAAGEVWAAAVNDVNDYFQNNPSPSFPYSNQVVAFGAIDVEPGFCVDDPCPANAEDWADSYSSTTDYWPYDDYGACDGCPPSTTGGGAYGDWTVSELYHVSYGADWSFAFPQIFTTNGIQAAQWERVSEWGVANGNYGAVGFDGVLTQYVACLQADDTPSPYDDCSSDVRNTPQDGWDQMWNALNDHADYNNHAAPSSVNTIPNWLSDIEYQ